MKTKEWTIIDTLELVKMQDTLYNDMTEESTRFRLLYLKIMNVFTGTANAKCTLKMLEFRVDDSGDVSMLASFIHCLNKYN